MDTRSPAWIRIARGTAAEMPAASSASLQIGDEFHQTDTGDKYKLSITALGVLEWYRFGPSAGSLSGKYWVSDDGLAPYATVQAAIDAAVADGHTNANPAQVWVMPGTYPGSVTLQSGIHVSGTEGPIPQGVNITGQVVFDPTETGGVHLNNLAIAPVGKAGITVTGILAAVLQCNGCRIIGDGNPAVMLISGTGTSSASFDNCSLGKSGVALVNTGIINCSVTWGTGLTVTNSTVDVSNITTERAVRIASPTAAVFRDVFMIGQYHALAAGTNELWNCRVRTNEQAAYFLDGGTTVDIFGGAIAFDTAANAAMIDKGAGAGTLSVTQTIFLGNGRRINPAIVQTTNYHAEPNTLDVIAVSTVLAQATDVIYADAGALGISITLPLTGAVVDKTLITILYRSGPGALSILPAAGETIDGGAGLTPALGTSVQLIADHANANWQFIVD